MQCPKCHSENREGRKFCAECGLPLAIPCSHCEFVNEPGERFCGGCGTFLGEGRNLSLTDPEEAEDEAADVAEIVYAEQEYGQTATVYQKIVHDRRRFPRLILRLGGQVLLADGRTVKVTVHDVSPDGIQIRCDRIKALALYPEARSIPDGETGPILQVVFNAPLKAGRVPVKVEGGIIFFALINPNLVAFGIKFKTITAGTRKTLNTLIKECLEPLASTNQSRP